MVSNSSKLLSPRELAEAIGVSESSLKRWADDGVLDVTRTAGGHRRIRLAEAIRFIRESHSPLVRPEILGLADLDAVAGQIPAKSDQTELLYRELEDGHGSQVRGLILSMYLAGSTVAEICDGPLHAAFTRLGELWQESDRGVFIEHRATDICIQALNQLRLMLTIPDDAAVAIGGAPDREISLLSSIAAATVLKSIGMSAINLGAQTPVDAMIHAAMEHRARLVWISVTHLSDAVMLTKYLNRLADALEPIGASIMVGGRMASHLQLPVSSSVQIGQWMSELAAFARGITADRPTGTTA